MKIFKYILIISATLFTFICIQIVGCFRIELKSFIWINYSLIEWVLQILWWIIAIMTGILISKSLEQ